MNFRADYFSAQDEHPADYLTVQDEYKLIIRLHKMNISCLLVCTRWISADYLSVKDIFPSWLLVFTWWILTHMYKMNISWLLVCTRLISADYLFVQDEYLLVTRHIQDENQLIYRLYKMNISWLLVCTRWISAEY